MAKKGNGKKGKGPYKLTPGVVVQYPPSKRNPRGARRTVGSKGGNSSANSLIHAVCSNMNPFCEAARGAKLHDSNAAPSIPYQSRDLIIVTSDANGIAGIMTGSASSALAFNATVVAGLVTAWTTVGSSSFYNQFNASTQSCRIVSQGFRFRTTQSYMDATGSLIVVKCGPTLGSTGQSVVSVSQGLQSEFTPVRDASIECVAVPLGIQATEYVDVTTRNNYNTFQLFFSGCTPSTQIGTIEMITNYEFIVKSDNALSTLSTQAAADIPQVLSIRSNTLTSSPWINKFTSALTSDHNWMDAVSKNIGRLGNMASTVANLFPAGRAANGIRSLENVGMRMMLGN